MKTIKLKNSGLVVPAIVVGCMRINSIEKNEASRFVKSAMDMGANFFDHSDRYGAGECESIFADAIGMNSSIREKIILQSKCGICPNYYDLSKEHILQSVDAILKRLKTEYLDMLLLHRPDALMEMQEIAEAFDVLHNEGKVRNFGVSNFNPMQILLLKKHIHQEIAINQLQLSITNSSMISSGMHVNMLDDAAVNRDGSVLDFCTLHDITIQA
jgi:predicted oxidoreductase